MSTLEELVNKYARHIAAEANKCCHRDDGFEEKIYLEVKAAMHNLLDAAVTPTHAAKPWETEEHF